MNAKPYNKRQLDIINGIVDIKSVSGQAVGFLLKKAIALNDEDVPLERTGILNKYIFMIPDHQ